jgi:hypothetical protein
LESLYAAIDDWDLTKPSVKDNIEQYLVDVWQAAKDEYLESLWASTGMPKRVNE